MSATSRKTDPADGPAVLDVGVDIATQARPRDPSWRFRTIGTTYSQAVAAMPTGKALMTDVGMDLARLVGLRATQRGVSVAQHLRDVLAADVLAHNEHLPERVAVSLHLTPAKSRRAP